MSLLLNQPVYAFGAVLVVVLASLCLGAAIVGGLARVSALAPQTLLGAALALSAVGLASLPARMHAVTDGLRYLSSPEGWPGYLGAALETAAACAGLPMLAAALVFPSVLSVSEVSGRRDRPVAVHLGRLVAADITTAIVGALMAPLVLLSLAGPWASCMPWPRPPTRSQRSI